MSRTSLAVVLSLAALTATPALAQDHAHGHDQAAGSVAAEAGARPRLSMHSMPRSRQATQPLRWP